MLPLVLVLAGLACLVVGGLILRTLGPRYRVGRLLAAAPQATLEEAVALADANVSRYVRLHGRISSDEEFPDDHDRPLVYRRRRVEVREGGQWRSLVDDREAVPFGIEARGTYIAVDATGLDHGLVVITREADGHVADLPADLQEGVAVELPSRLVIEQVSAVEHAFVCGVPVRSGDEVLIGPGLGRPLVLTTLELDAAMRVLGRGHRRQLQAAVALLPAGGLLLAGAAIAVLLGVS
jgi:hypothetical protein